MIKVKDYIDKENDQMKKFHFYNFAFFCKDFYGRSLVSSGCRGFKGKNVTWGDIQETRNQMKAPDSAILLSVSYLGYMTLKEFDENEG